jgi:tRNA G10  N-methylase Trm11
MLRKELMSRKDEGIKLVKLAEKAKVLAQEQNEEAIQNQKIADEHITQRIALRSKHEEDKAKFEDDVLKLQIELQRREQSLRDTE